MTATVRRRLPGRRREPMPWGVPGLIATLAVLAIALAAASGRVGDAGPLPPWTTVVALFVVLTTSAFLHVEFRHGADDVDALDLFEAAIAPTLLLVPGAPAVALVAGAKLLSEVVLRVRPVKAAFNVAAWAAAAGVGSVVLLALGTRPPLGGRDLAALVAAMVAVVVCNQLFFVAVLRLSGGRTTREVLAQLRPAIVPGWVVGGAVTLSFGLLFAAACAWEPALAWVLPVPLGALHWAGQSYAASRAEHERAEAIHHATTLLTTADDPGGVIPDFLQAVRAGLHADAVDLVTVDPGEEPSILRIGPGDDRSQPGEPGDVALALALSSRGARARVTVLSSEPAIRDGLRHHGWRDCLVAPVPSVGTPRRVLCVYDPGGLLTSDPGVLAMLEGLAGEVGGALARADAQASLRASEARYRALLQRSSDLVVVLDPSGTIVDVIPDGGAPPLRFEVGGSVTALAHPDDVASIEQCLERLLGAPRSICTATWRSAAADGTWRHLETMVTNLVDDEAVGGIVCNVRDTTDRERAAALVAGQAEVLGSISRRSPLEETVGALAHVVEAQAPGSRFTVVLLSGDGAVTVLGSPLPRALVNALAEALAPADHRGTPPEPLVVDDVATDPRWARSTAGSGVGALWAAPIDRSSVSGARGIGVLHFDHPRSPDDTDRRVLASAADLAHIAIDAVATQSRLVHQATHDALTGLPNRVLFLDRASVALARLARTGRMVAVLFVDLDRFKAVNDSLGHDVGDRLLVVLAARLQRVMRPSDTVARFGGDEFTILCEEIRDLDEAAAIATRVRSLLAAPVGLAGHDLYVTASVGIAHTSDHRRSPTELVEAADAAMYRAKQVGGDRHHLYDEGVRSRALHDLVTDQALRKAIERNQLVVHYQPAIDLATGLVSGTEALVRWEHPEEGLLGPGAFIPLAEENGLIIPLGTQVLGDACAQRGRWRAEVGDDVVMSVNLSARQFADPGLPEVVAAALAASGTRPQSLELEITESTLMEHAGATMEALHALKDLGVRLAIDDFGTGYSSLTYLKRFPVDVLKVDKSFVDGLGTDLGDEAIVRTIVELAHTLGMTAVAEGVETPSQVERLRALGCDVAQGYWFSRPLPAAEVALHADHGAIDLRDAVSEARSHPRG